MWKETNERRKRNNNKCEWNKKCARKNLKLWLIIIMMTMDDPLPKSYSDYFFSVAPNFLHKHFFNDCQVFSLHTREMIRIFSYSNENFNGQLWRSKRKDFQAKVTTAGKAKVQENTWEGERWKWFPWRGVCEITTREK